MLSPLPRRSDWASVSLIPSSRISLPRKGCRVGLRIVLFEACSAFTRVAACTLALSPMRDTLECKLKIGRFIRMWRVYIGVGEFRVDRVLLIFIVWRVCHA
jgi:hypothetical protein